jgi:electron transfer flavoprotein alpha subunit
VRIIVCIKQVPDSAALQIDPDSGTLRRAGAPAVVNPFDEPAVEEGLRLRERTGGTLTVLTLGPPQAEAALRETLARGADEAVLLSDPAFAGSDTWATSLALAAAVRKLGGADVLLFGRQATDGDTAQVGPAVAAHLDLPLLAWTTGIVAVDATTLTVQRQLDDGTETLQADFPCVLTIGRRIHPLRFASLARHLSAQRHPILHWQARDLGLAPQEVGLNGSPTRVVRLFAPPRTGTCQFLTGTTGEIGRELHARIRQVMERPSACTNHLATRPSAPQNLGARQPAEPVHPPPASLSDSIWIVAECVQGKPITAVCELLGVGRRLADTLSTSLVAVLLASGDADDAVRELWQHGADGVLVAQAESFAPVEDTIHARALSELAVRHAPSVMLFAATAIGRVLAPQVAVRLHTGLTADCTGLAIDTATGQLLQTRPAFGGNLLATIITPRHRPQLATVRPKVMTPLPAISSRRGWLLRETTTDPPPRAARRLAFESGPAAGESLADATLIVAGGRGIGSAEGFGKLRRLAERLGGMVGASRAAVDAGWMPVSAQIGQTGTTVRPRVYLAVGISGQIQHLAGMSGADCIIAVNKDATAPIFSIAHIGVVADWRQIVQQELATGT